MRLGFAALVLSLFVSACTASSDDGSESGTKVPGSPTPTSNAQTCFQLGSDWALQASEDEATVLLGKVETIRSLGRFLEGHYAAMRSAGCAPELIAEVSAANAIASAVEEEIATCLRRHGPAVEAGQRYCVQAGGHWKNRFAPRVVRVRDLIARLIAPSAERLSTKEVCSRLSGVLPLGLQKLDRQIQIAVLGDFVELRDRGDAQAQDLLKDLAWRVSNLATGSYPEHTRIYYAEDLAAVQVACKRAGAPVKLVRLR